MLFTTSTGRTFVGQGKTIFVMPKIFFELFELEILTLLWMTDFESEICGFLFSI